jgi:hypothetical protein
MALSVGTEENFRELRLGGIRGRSVDPVLVVGVAALVMVM